MEHQKLGKRKWAGNIKMSSLKEQTLRAGKMVYCPRGRGRFWQAERQEASGLFSKVD